MDDICRFSPPAWLHAFADRSASECYAGDDAAIQLAIRLSAWSIDHGGGPFGAVVIDHATGKLVSVGGNLVVAAQCSHWHAEMVALLLAERALNNFDLGAHPLTLASSCEPCVMCLGATLWSGIRRVVTAALDSDARAIGFDEGPKPKDWAMALRERGIEVVTELHREAAVEQLRRYKRLGGPIYNASRPAS